MVLAFERANPHPTIMIVKQSKNRWRYLIEFGSSSLGAGGFYSVVDAATHAQAQIEKRLKKDEEIKERRLYSAAEIAGREAGKASMIRAGRKRWNHEDFLIATRTKERYLSVHNLPWRTASAAKVT